MARKINKKAKLTFAILAIAMVAVVAIIAAGAIKTTGKRQSAFSVSSGSSVYNANGISMEVSGNSTISLNLDGKYHLATGDQDITLGTHAVVFSGADIKVYGGGFKLAKTGEIIQLDDNAIVEIGTTCFIKLGDRKYLMVSPTINDTTKVFEAKQFVYIVMDVVGNAKILSTNMALKTTQPTTIVGDVMKFDIANEIVTIGNQTFDVAKLMGGSTNTYETGVYKRIEEEQTPDVVNIVVKGGDGGDGGSGGNGGSGGRGGNGGTGGRGGAGGTSDEHDLIETAMIKSLTSTATTITANYFLVDPYGSLGTVYLELHDASKLGSLTISDLYADQSDFDDEKIEMIENYWATTSNYRRVSIGAYDNQYTFTGLEDGNEYYVVMAHRTSDEEGAVSNYLDDYAKIRTAKKENYIKVDTIDSTGLVYLILKLDNVKEVPVGSTVQLFNEEGVAISNEYLIDDIAIEESSKKNGHEFTLTIASDKLTTSKYIIAKVLNEDKEQLLISQSYNSFYK